MSDILVRAGSWVLLIFFGGQALVFIGLALWTIWIDAIKPRLIPNAQIEREADAIIANYPDPEFEAFTRHDRAWRHGEGAEQVYWLRVRKAVMRQMQS